MSQFRRSATITVDPLPLVRISPSSSEQVPKHVPQHVPKLTASFLYYLADSHNTTPFAGCPGPYVPGNMCGIHATITTSTDSGLSSELRQALINRGPDHFGQAQRDLPGADADRQLHLYFTSTVLALRGDHVTEQPLEENTAAGSVLCWNGEAWRIDSQPVGGNDGEAVFSMLQSSSSSSRQIREAHVLDVLRSIEGPFAFVYYDSAASRVYYGRDRLGRRSLLIKLSGNADSITLSSIASVPTAGWEEVSSDGVWSIDLKSCDGIPSRFSFQDRRTKHTWLQPGNDEMVSCGGP